MLINCIECGHTVSDKAVSCPNCGYPVTTATTLLPIPVEEVENPKPRTRKKHKKLPNGYGSIKKLSGNRRNPYAAYPPTSGFKLNGSPVTMPALGYYEDWYKAFDALREYNKNPYDVKRNELTFAQVYEMFYNNKYVANKKRTLSASSIGSTKAAYKNLSSLHEKTYSSLRKLDMQSVIDACPLKHSSISSMVSLLKQIGKFAMENDIISKDYAQYVTINIPDDNEAGEPFSTDELRILWDNCNNDTVQIILIMIYSGYRIKAFETIEINLEERYFKGGVKTAAGKGRLVPIHNSIYEYVKSFNAATFRTENFRLKQFYPVLKSLGIDTTASGKKHTPHDCRHTFSWLCDKYKVDDLSKHLLMGHSLGSDVEKSVYGHRTLDELRAEINKIMT